MIYRFPEILEHTYKDPQPINAPVSSQEEADTRIVLHCVYATIPEGTSRVLLSLSLSLTHTDTRANTRAHTHTRTHTHTHTNTHTQTGYDSESFLTYVVVQRLTVTDLYNLPHIHTRTHTHTNTHTFTHSPTHMHSHC